MTPRIRNDSTAQRITVDDYRTDDAVRQVADRIIATLGYDAADVVELRVSNGCICVDVLVRRTARIRTDTWPLGRQGAP